MSSQFDINAVLSELEKPGRYLGGEFGAEPNLKADAKGRLMKIALAFPDVYEIAHSHLGHKILYSMVNNRPGLSADRVYAPWHDLENMMTKAGAPLTSLERRIPLKDFEIIGFSLQYELGYSAILNMLKLGGVPILRTMRDDKAPLVAAGGPGAYNPEPLSDFIDIFFLGDAEHSFIDDLEIIKEWRFEQNAPKSELYERLAGRPGIYIPALFEPQYSKEGLFCAITALKSGYDRAERAASPSLETAPFPVCQIVPFIKAVHDRVVLEIGRGCSRGCRFCQAGYIYRPVRERSAGKVMELAESNLKNSGQDDISFLSLSAGDHTQIDQMMSGFMDKYAQEAVALSLPSLRVKSLRGSLAQQIKRVRKTGFTLAPEAGTQRLRDVINKDLTEDDLFNAAEVAFKLGWRTLKLYFMAGLPTETEDDLAAMVELARRVKKMSRGQINLGVAHFTPKAHTPFQWQPGSTVEQITKRLQLVRDAARSTQGMTPKWNDPGASWVESLLARGDRRLGQALKLVHEKGARFEAWGDQFKVGLWVEALEEAGLNEEMYLREKSPDEPLPYDHIFAGVEKDFLKDELQKANQGQTTSDCRWHGCHNCGACRGELAINLADPSALPDEQPAQPGQAAQTEAQPAPPIEQNRPEAKASYLINFKKEGRLIYLGHLEMVEVFKRAFKRAGLNLAMSQGFHPQPKLSFLTALPLGMPSQDEYLRISLTEHKTVDEITAQLAKSLPGGLTIKNAVVLGPSAKPMPTAATFRFISPVPVFKPGRPLFPEAEISYTNSKGLVKNYRLSDFVAAAEAQDERTAIITIKSSLTGTPKTLPTLAALWGLDIDSLSGDLYKLETILA